MARRTTAKPRTRDNLATRATPQRVPKRLPDALGQRIAQPVHHLETLHQRERNRHIAPVLDAALGIGRNGAAWRTTKRGICGDLSDDILGTLILAEPACSRLARSLQSMEARTDPRVGTGTARAKTSTKPTAGHTRETARSVEKCTARDGRQNRVTTPSQLMAWSLR